MIIYSACSKNYHHENGTEYKTCPECRAACREYGQRNKEAISLKKASKRITHKSALAKQRRASRARTIKQRREYQAGYYLKKKLEESK